ncbi:hypothetical protein AG1IA_04108 [Rhizoctonia solani AG-1 IA]|uniref:Uncharacterized protein n=1 Tax=Thanatephorus cucumeris (strain AG1-IA) TaxID=983506 RepID=L8WYH2_THACA|nr:hypothetical protein AG1IA_04108 [Rhizoctonia solani AG-1 IA]
MTGNKILLAEHRGLKLLATLLPAVAADGTLEVLEYSCPRGFMIMYNFMPDESKILKAQHTVFNYTSGPSICDLGVSTMAKFQLPTFSAVNRHQ